MTLPQNIVENFFSRRNDITLLSQKYNEETRRLAIVVESQLVAFDSKKIADELATILTPDITIEIVITNRGKTQIQPIIGVKNTILIASGKGGVGKSTISVNTATALASIGYNVGIVDADIHGPSLSIMLNLNNKPDIVDKMMMPTNVAGLHAISLGQITEASEASLWRGPMVSKVVNQLVRGTRWDNIDYMIIDSPPGTSDVHFVLCQNMPITCAIIVSTAQKTALADSAKSIDMFKKFGISLLGIVHNMSGGYFGSDESVMIFAEQHETKIIGTIPFDKAIGAAGDDGVPYFTTNSNSEFRRNFGLIAEQICEAGWIH